MLQKLPPKFWWLCLSLFALHQFWEKFLGWHIPLLDNYLDPLLAMPIILGIHLAERRVLFRQGPDFVLSGWEVGIITLFFAVFFEEGLPKWEPGFVRDVWDYFCYGVGAIGFLGFGNGGKI